ncbi:MAG: DUF2851 family protein [Bacteroidia bacterium]|nr:DUF2851 family protein [Bacteroidia bacterium]
MYTTESDDPVKEDLLQLIWKLKKFDLVSLSCTNGALLSILDFGLHNHNSGPDFINAKIKIDDTIWVGHIEIHVKASEWYQHKHHLDPAYDNVILHVVYTYDKDVYNSKSTYIPTLTLDTRISEKTLLRFEDINSSLSWIPCASQIHKIDKARIQLELESIYIRRLESKSQRIFKMLNQNKNDWEECLYQLLFQYLGLKINGDAFKQLSFKAPYKLFKKYTHNIFLAEAFLFGQAGMLQNQDAYFRKLGKEYDHLKLKHNLTPMSGVEWHFLRLRPANFPTIRIAQLAMLYSRFPSLFSVLIRSFNKSSLDKIFDSGTSSYWSEHYIPGRPSTFKLKKIGKTSLNLLLINVVVPIIFSYARKTGNNILVEKSIDIISRLPAEKNKITNKWFELGIESKNALKSQALIELKSNFCDKYKCMNCPIGQQLLFR